MHTIVLAIQYSIHRKGIRAIAQPHFGRITFIEIQDGDDLVRLVANREVHLIILDPELPDLVFERLLELTTGAQPPIPVLIYSEGDELPHVASFIRNGAMGYVAQKCSGDELVYAIDTVLKGDIYLSEDASARHIDADKTNLNSATTLK